jgi:hypothetical protein
MRTGVRLIIDGTRILSFRLEVPGRLKMKQLGVLQLTFRIASMDFPAEKEGLALGLKLGL